MTEHLVLVALRLAVVGAGGLLSLWILRLLLRGPEHRGTYLLLFLGFGLVTLGAIVEGVLFEFARWDLFAAHAAEALVSAVGLGLVLLAIVRSQV